MVMFVDDMSKMMTSLMIENGSSQFVSLNLPADVVHSVLSSDMYVVQYK